MKYVVKFTEDALFQMDEIHYYIANILMKPKAAQRWINKLYTEAKQLETMPLIFPLVS